MNKKQDQPLRIGLTGGIASGKSTIANQFADLGVPVIDADQIARQVVEPGEPGLASIVDEFGPELLESDGRLNRQALRSLVFSDPNKRLILENILHPLIGDSMLVAAHQASGPYQIWEVPLLLETGFDQLVNRVLVADIPASMQRERLSARDLETSEQIERILEAQMNREDRLKAADDVIDNSGSEAKTRAQVEKLHAHYLKLSEIA
ncbi:MAG: dephospho-CoA kinase [Gammaproteobacteria bacterium]|nr:dephospho-CoA kinase [Gammaproteobacteria bacterium]